MTLKIKNFNCLTISIVILKELERLGFKKMTKIQKICIPPSLKGFDVIGSARTGSGKTLCYALPAIHKIYLLGWSFSNSIFSTILAPTRELCIQLFNFFKAFGNLKFLKTAILIGGGNSKKKKFYNSNSINLIATPGCLLKTISEEKVFDFDFLKILIIDEVDKILDMGFKNFFYMILKYLPKKKQILLYSATLTSRLKNLARLNLKNPFYGCVKTKIGTTGQSLIENFPIISKKIFQFFGVLFKQKKINILFSFLKSHIKKKILVFFSTKKQVKFFYIFLKKLKKNFNLFNIHGDMNQNKRIENFVGFSRSKSGILLATDVMARGIDFPSIDWVIQMDCPENEKTYLHRIGRAGRFFEIGKSLLILKFTEIKFLDILKKNSIEIRKINFNNNQILNISEKIKNFAKKNKKFKKIAEDAFFNYMRFIFLQKNKYIFDIENINWEETLEEFGINQLLLKKT